MSEQQKPQHCPFCGPPKLEEDILEYDRDQEKYFCSRCFRRMKFDEEKNRWAHDLKEWPLTPTAREVLILAFSAAPLDPHVVVDALDQYLAEDPADRAPAMPFLPPVAELTTLRAELEAAIKRAEIAEARLQEKKN